MRNERSPISNWNSPTSTSATRITTSPRDHLRNALDLVGSSEFRADLRDQLNRLNEQVELFRAQLTNLAASQPEMANPFEQFQYALQNGYPGIALEMLENAEGQGARPEQVLPIRVDLYNQIGRPELAFDLLESTAMGDQALATGPGMAGYRQGVVYALLGYYATAGLYLQNEQNGAIPTLRAAIVGEAVSAGRSPLVGDPIAAVRTALQIAGSPTSSGQVETQATWESLVGFLKLEGGQPLDILDSLGNVTSRGAAGHFVKALELDPEIPSRPILLYYLEQMGVEPPDAAGSEPESDAQAESSTSEEGSALSPTAP